MSETVFTETGLVNESRPIRSDSVAKLAEALSKAQGVMENAARNAANPFYHSKYAPLSSVWDAARKPLSDNGLAVIQTTRVDNGELVLDTFLVHSSGEWMSSSYPIQPVKNDPQGVGSAITYARRYTFSAIVGMVADDDDDGNSASGKDAPKGERSADKPVPPSSAGTEKAAPKKTTEPGMPKGEMKTGGKGLPNGSDKPGTADISAVCDAMKTGKLSDEKIRGTLQFLEIEKHFNKQYFADALGTYSKLKNKERVLSPEMITEIDSQKALWLSAIEVKQSELGQ